MRIESVDGWRQLELELPMPRKPRRPKKPVDKVAEAKHDRLTAKIVREQRARIKAGL
jgi:hypothetical protein